MVPPATGRSRAIYALVLAAIAAYLLAARLWHMNDTFLMLRDQIRDWRYALGPFRDLPLTGTQSTAGGSSLGPIYYWLLWLTRVVIGPFTRNLPHTGAIGLALLQTAGDLLLLYAVRVRTGSLWTAAAATLFAATAAHDLAVSSTIWNPSVSVAFCKVALALVLLDSAASMVRMIGVTVAIWFAVQAHSAAIFIAIPLLGMYVVRDLAAGRLAGAWHRARAILEVILLLQLPFLYHLLTHPSEAGPTRALAGASETIAGQGAFRLGDSIAAVGRLGSRILFTPFDTSWWAPLVGIAALVVLIRARRDLSLLGATVLPVAFTALGFALWQGNYDEYWFLPVTPCLALTVTLAITWGRQERAAPIFLALVIAAQPFRLSYAQQIYRMPEYGALARGAREIYRQTKVVRRIDTTFKMPPFSEAGFPYEAMGGREAPEGAFDALIDDAGRVRFTPVR